MKFIIKCTIGFTVVMVVVLLISYMNAVLKLGITETDFQEFITFSLVIGFLIYLYPGLSTPFKNSFLKTKELHIIVCIPILTSLIKLIIVYLYLYIPVFFGEERMSVGKGQYIREDQELSTLGEILLLSISGPFNEEFLFRFLLLFLIPYSILNSFSYMSIDKENGLFNRIKLMGERLNKKIFVERNNTIVAIWLFITSSIFSLMHLPDIYSFFIYFIGGMLYGFLFIKYGFLLAWIAHGISNGFSPIVNSIYTSIFGS
ncbi:CPBP family intramembrane glutamic endopeptidase [Halalkalibacter akibai]|uniref:CAAX amino terminal protease family family n=1 Tax=Halalkalibacter akibai (strain ATCC 43226 / DSM 21942 / CIP 109018 / JCM 9157 / 1139) TaxID=1236973 RepID=W4QUN7_HALA3|nr:CPBP family intramembrane glutamic endopeptidase [Halalkalibacter akibai]GAE35612.1 CAAX amino terminal protease family family [Halalkalibacter akibai JCM 9157]